ncbi:MAG: hypothetical protein M3Y41_18615 [Pseudomonadota bacterium]|nr:hypothetical protein [Pseudomonadota bacterium]
MNKHVVGTIAILATLGACVANTMRTYVGQDVRQVELAYGPPSNVIDLGGGTRAYQWSRISVSSTPASAVTTTSKDKKGRRYSETQFVGGGQSVSRCLYTFMTAWSPPQNGWIVTGIRQPSLDCAIGGLDAS